MRNGHGGAHPETLDVSAAIARLAVPQAVGGSAHVRQARADCGLQGVRLVPKVFETKTSTGTATLSAPFLARVRGSLRSRCQRTKARHQTRDHPRPIGTPGQAASPGLPRISRRSRRESPHRPPGRCSKAQGLRMGGVRRRCGRPHCRARDPRSGSPCVRRGPGCRCPSRRYLHRR